MTVELSFKDSALVPEPDPQCAADDQIPYLKVSGFPDIPQVEMLLKTTFGNQLPSKNKDSIEVTLTGTDEAILEFENSEGRQVCHNYCSLTMVFFFIFRLPLFEPKGTQFLGAACHG